LYSLFHPNLQNFNFAVVVTVVVGVAVVTDVTVITVVAIVINEIKSNFEIAIATKGFLDSSLETLIFRRGVIDFSYC
jgi:hypothetical protein